MDTEGLQQWLMVISFIPESKSSGKNKDILK